MRQTTPQLTTYVVSSREHGDLCIVTASNTHQAAAVALDALRNSALPDHILAALVESGFPFADSFTPIDATTRGATVLDAGDGGAQ